MTYVEQEGQEEHRTITAFTGGIDYLSPVFGLVDWKRVESQWFEFPDAKVNDTTLKVEAQDFHSDGFEGEQCCIVLDAGDSDSTQGVPGKCVVLGIDKPAVGATPESRASRKHYVFVLGNNVREDGSGSQSFKRIGAGFVYEKMSRAEQKLG